MLHPENHIKFSEPQQTYLQNENGNIYIIKVERQLGQLIKYRM